MDERNEARDGTAAGNTLERSAGCVFVRTQGGRREGLLIRVRREGFELPKGHLEAGETAEQAALRELREETGLESAVKLGPELGEVEYTFDSEGATITKRVRYFYAAPGDELPLVFGARPKKTRELRWVTAAEVSLVGLVRESLRAIIAKGLAVEMEG